MVELAIKNEQWSLYKIVDSIYTIYIYDRHCYDEVEFIALIDKPMIGYKDTCKIKMKRSQFLKICSLDIDNILGIFSC